ncbi:aminoacyl-tRNA hydrolase [Acidobacteriota bacterium]
MKVVIGLGNPGRKYERTRHNVGFQVVDLLADMGGGNSFKRKDSFLRCGARLAGTEVILVKPMTYMNLSGQAVDELLDRYNDLELSDLMLVYDDLDLPLGRIRIRSGGSHGGHKGVLSVIETLGEKKIPRVRLGIRPSELGVEDPVEFVLSRFTENEEPKAEEMIRQGRDAIICILRNGLTRAMNLYNRPPEAEMDGGQEAG